MPDATTRVLTAHVPLPLAEKVDRLAERLDRSRGRIIRQALAAWVDKEEVRRSRPLDVPASAGARRGS